MNELINPPKKIMGKWYQEIFIEGQGTIRVVTTKYMRKNYPDLLKKEEKKND